jgi:hypothetical protein
MIENSQSYIHSEIDVDDVQHVLHVANGSTEKNDEVKAFSSSCFASCRLLYRLQVTHSQTHDICITMSATEEKTVMDGLAAGLNAYA